MQNDRKQPLRRTIFCNIDEKADEFAELVPQDSSQSDDSDAEQGLQRSFHSEQQLSLLNIIEQHKQACLEMIE